MHLGLERNRINAFRFGSDPVRPIWPGLNPASLAQSSAQANDPAGQSNTRVATLFKWIKIHFNSVMVIKAKREEDESWALFYSSVLLILLSQCLLGAGVRLFPCFPQHLILLLLHFHVSTVHVNSGDLEVQKKKKKQAPLVTGRRRKNTRLWLLEGSSVTRLWLLCCNTVC